MFPFIFWTIFRGMLGRKICFKENIALKNNPTATLIRRLLLSYLIALTVTYLFLPDEWQALDTAVPLSILSPYRILSVTSILMLCLSLLGLFFATAPFERVFIALTYTILTALSLLRNPFSMLFFTVCLLIEIALIFYVVRGWNKTIPQADLPTPAATWQKNLLILITLTMFALISVWGISRVIGFATPTYDFGIFAQMFHSMKTSGLPIFGFRKRSRPCGNMRWRIRRLSRSNFPKTPNSLPRARLQGRRRRKRS